jgi:phosphomannomutase/phosphoglucomutase
MKITLEKSIFREYDIRGIFEKELNEKSVKLIGYFLGQKIAGDKIVAIGYDARSHSPVLRDYLTSGLNAAGCTVLDMGMVATPVNYYSNYIDFNGVTTDASIMITGSHNPSEYNGFKMTLDQSPFFGASIYALGDEIIANQEIDIKDNIKKTRIDVKTPYIDFMVKQFSHLRNFPKKIIIDGGNGVADTVITDIFNALNFNYEGLYLEPDGTFPNHHPDPSEEKNLVDVKALLDEKGDIAFAYDGDADRIAVLTHKHNIKGDQMALLYSMKMDKPTVIGEVKCSQVMYDELERRGAKAIMYKTGHSNLKVKMKETNADQVFSTEEIKVKTSEEEKFAIIDKVKELLKNPPSDFPKILNIIDVDGVRINFEKGWGLVRASNTTPVLVTRFESTDEKLAKIYEEQVNTLIQVAKGLL